MDRSSLYARLGQLIRERRRELGLTQERLASQVSISRASIANIETGRQRILVHQLYMIAEKLDVEPVALLPGPDEIRDLQPLDNLSFSENVGVELRRKIADLLREAK